ncbi:ion channel [Clostridium sp.]|uniref:ion channel n=1 Tax=Clostridium sp. TaxID=1506 RepID=UPI0032173D4D
MSSNCIVKCSRCVDYDKIIKFNYKNLNFNGNTQQDYIDIKLEDVRYSDCEFRNISFKNNSFSNAIFISCKFINCKFIRGRISLRNFLEFNKCILENLYIDNCDFSSLYIKECSLYKVDFKNSFMKGCNFIKNSYDEVRFIDDCNLMDCIIKEMEGTMDIKFINEKSYTKLNYGSYIGKFNYKDMKKNNGCINKKEYCNCICKANYLNISFSYMDFGGQYLRNNVSGRYGRCFYQSKLAFHRTLKGRKKFYSYVANIVCGYGEKPYRSFMLSLIIILIFALLYMITGISCASGIIGFRGLIDNFSVGMLLKNVIYCIHFSLVTFSTVGYGDLLPYNMSGIILTSIEIIMGIIMIGIWTSTLVRKMTR